MDNEEWKSALSRFKGEWPTNPNIDDIIATYDKYECYDGDMVLMGYRAPEVFADEVSKAGFPKDSLILDTGCGSGLLGEKFREHGFTELHGHDGSAVILDQARQKGIYKKLICCLMGDGHNLPEGTGGYDGVINAGGVAPGHFPANAFHQMLRIVKPGGFFAYTCREEHIHRPQFAELLPYYQSLVEKSILELIVDKVYDNYYANCPRDIPGRLQIYKVLQTPDS